MPDARDIDVLTDTPQETRVKLKATAIAAGIPAESVTRELIDYLVGTMDEARLIAEPALYEAMRAGLTGPANPASIAAARRMAERNAATLIKGLVDTELAKVGPIIADNIAAGAHPSVAARQLTMVKGLNQQGAATARKYAEYLQDLTPELSAKEFKRRYEAKLRQLVNKRRRVIAQTEQRYATEEGAAIQATERGAKFKTWITSGDGRVSDACRSNEAAGWVKLDAQFPGGVRQPPQHPRCRCAVSYREAQPDAAAKDRAKARADKTAAATEVEAVA